MTDSYLQQSTATTTLGINPIPAPTAAIVGSPLSVSAGGGATLDASASVCTTQGGCSYFWTVSCPGKADVTKAGDNQRVTTGIGSSVDVDLWGAPPVFSCMVTLRVDGAFGLTHTAQTTLQVRDGGGSIPPIMLWVRCSLAGPGNVICMAWSVWGLSLLAHQARRPHASPQCIACNTQASLPSPPTAVIEGAPTFGVTAGEGVVLAATGSECAAGCDGYVWKVTCGGGATVIRSGASSSVGTGHTFGDIDVPILTSEKCK